MVFKRAIMKDINQVMVEIIRSNDLADFSRNVRERTIKRIDCVLIIFMNWRLNSTDLSFAHIM
jgi:hypothetical protein